MLNQPIAIPKRSVKGNLLHQMGNLLHSGTKPDSRDPDYSRTGIFVHHNCWRCKDGAQPCVQGSPNRCEYPHARND